MQQTELLLPFLDHSPSPFHGVLNSKKILDQAGYQELFEDQHWPEPLSGKYYVTRNDSSLIAFDFNKKALEKGVKLIGAHTDSPCLKVKPRGDEQKQDHWTLGIETYGGVLLATWFDRDLSLAGRVSFLDPKGNLQHQLVNLKKPIAVIPSLAIHLRRNANEGWKINPQKELSPLLSLPGGPDNLRQLLSEQAGLKGSEILDYDLVFYPTESAQLIGVNQDMITSARLDNLVSCFAAITSLVNKTGQQSALVVLNDHEEIGSGTASGAAGNFLETLFTRLYPNPNERSLLLSRSCLFSADNAHGVHPNYPDLHDPQHAPKLGEGPVIKSNANGSYITDSTTSAKFQQICKLRNIPFQHFSIRADLRCGSTIGPLTARRLGLKGLDVGVPTLAMHSIRELMAKKDLSYLIEAMTGWFESE